MKFKNNTKEAQEKLNKAIIKSLYSLGEHLEGEAKALAPVKTGALRGDITYEVNEEKKILRYGNTDGIAYATKMEFGGSLKSPDGYLRKSAELNASQIKSYIENEVKEAMK